MPPSLDSSPPKQSTEPYEKRVPCGFVPPARIPTTTTTTTTKGMTTSPTAPSSGRTPVALTSSASPSSSETMEDKERDFLKSIPNEFDVCYRPIPIAIKTLLWSLSILVSVATISGKRNTLTFLENETPPGKTFKQIILLSIRIFVTGILSTAIVQDLFFSPSRVSTSYLRQMGYVPSSLSQFQIVQPSLPGSNPLDVHYLLYQPPPTPSQTTNPSYDALYFHHGFGASSLSWLPSLTPLTHKLRAKCAIAQDAVGFGLTERPPPSSQQKHLVDPYSIPYSAALGTTLLQNYLSSSSSRDDDDKPPKIALFGHSMGCIATLYMALQLPSHIEKTIVLVSPALRSKESNGILGKQTRRQVANRRSVMGGAVVWSNVLAPIRYCIRLLRYFVFDVPFRYTLKRLVSKESFWKKGLQSAWGNPRKVTSNTLLRYRWPSITTGWENGLLAYSRAQSQAGYRGDLSLLKQVLSLNNVRRVVILHGSKDKVIPLKNSETIVEEVERVVTLKVLEGQGHNPFEEDVDEFLSVVEEILGEEDG